MAAKRSRSRKPKFSRLLESCRQPVIVVDQFFEVVFANNSGCQWLGIASEDLLGSKLNYGSDSSDGPSANGICPPPDLFEKKSTFKIGQIFSDALGRRQWKQAVFSQLIDGDSGESYIQIIGADNEWLEADSNKIEGHKEHFLVSKMLAEDKLQYELDCLIGKSEYSKRLKKQIQAVIASGVDCIFTGPRGSGKEHVARCVFHQTANPEASLVPVHCSIADSLLIQNAIKEWVFDQKETRTKDWLLLLDVDQLSREAQSELEGYAEIPGFSLRILATAENDLESLAEQGRFSKSLAYQLSVQKIQLLPLVDRRMDIALLAQYFVEKQNEQSEKNISIISDEVSELFLEYHWPGNIDELRQVVQLSYEACNQSTVNYPDLPDSFKHALSAARIGPATDESIDLESVLEEAEKKLIENALKNARNNKTKAAESLGISRAKLLRRAKSLGAIQPPMESAKLIDESAFREAE